MKERPVSFYPAMVKAIKSGNKTHTRRVKNIPQEAFDFDYCIQRKKWAFLIAGADKPKYRQCPYGMPGDRLWVKENFAFSPEFDELKPSEVPRGSSVFYFADSPWDEDFGAARASMFMPRWASRILLEVEESHPERLQSINHEEAVAEGIEQIGMFGRFPRYRDYLGYAREGYTDGVMSFQTLWDSINGTKEGRRWADNPWVWDIGFKVLEVRR